MKRIRGDGRRLSFNRTIVELKLNYGNKNTDLRQAFNRTIVELKLQTK